MRNDGIRVHYDYDNDYDYDDFKVCLGAFSCLGRGLERGSLTIADVRMPGHARVWTGIGQFLQWEDEVHASTYENMVNEAEVEGWKSLEVLPPWPPGELSQ